MQSFSFQDRVFEPRHVLGWLCFTLAAGVVNAGAVLASNTVVTHITGNVTNVVLDGSVAMALVCVIGLFIGGAMLASFVRESLASKPRLAFVLPIGIAMAILIVTSVAGNLDAFGAFGAARDVTPRTFVMLGLLAGAMGMVNAAVASATENQVRTTHLSGPATDFAGNVIRGVLGRGKGHGTELRWAALRFAMLLTFALGAFVAAQLAGPLHYDVFSAAAAILLTAVALTAA